MIYTLTFNPAVDYIVRLPRMVPGRVNRASAASLQWGGKGVNVAVMLNRLGVKATALGFVAGVTGIALADGLRTQGVATEFFYLADGLTRINVKLKDGRETEINAPGPVVGAQDLAKLMRRLDALHSTDLLVLAGSIPAGLPQDCYRAITTRLAHRGVPFVADAEGPLLRGVLLNRPFLIKPNHLELEAMFGHSLHGRRDVQACAVKLQGQGARNVLVSMAGDGAVLLDETGAFHDLAAPAGLVCNSVGAGDAMVAGFLAGWHSTGDYASALAWGVAAGSATAFSDGLATREEVETLLMRMEGEAR